MESKRDRTVRLIKAAGENFLLCPVCGEKLALKCNYILNCRNGHSFDISKKGTVNLTGSGNDRIYDTHLFQSRRSVISSGNYDPLIEALGAIITQYQPDGDKKLSVLDAGCGEGSFFNRLCSEFIDRDTAELLVGADISKPGIALSTDHENDILWIVDDIANLHIRDNSFRIILNILSPANYSEFKRLLTRDGIVIKVIPGRNYLKEFRTLLNKDKVKDKDEDNAQYDNHETIGHAKKEMNILERHQVRYILTPGEKDFEAFRRMTPLTYGKTAVIENETLSEITLDLEILVGNF